MDASTPGPLDRRTTHWRILVTSRLSWDRPSEARVSVSVPWWHFTAVSYNNNNYNNYNNHYYYYITTTHY